MEPTEASGRRHEGGADPPPTSGGVTISLDYARFVNHAAQRNHIPVVNRVTLVYEGPVPLSHLTLTVSELALEPAIVRIERLDPGLPHQIEPRDVRFQEQYLAQLVEATDGELSCGVRTDEGRELGAPRVSLGAYGI